MQTNFQQSALNQTGRTTPRPAQQSRTMETASNQPYCSRIAQGDPYSVSLSKNGTASNASAPNTPTPDHVPVASSSKATTGFTAVCQTTACERYSRMDHSLSTR